jgi:hypothetical protein
MYSTVHPGLFGRRRPWCDLNRRGIPARFL